MLPTSDVVYCKCGRDRAKLHCPFCGCATVVGLATKTVVIDSATICSYRCRRCIKIFDDRMRELCSAPAPTRGRSLAAKLDAKVDSAMVRLTREEKLKIVHDKLRGISAAKKEETP